MHKTQKKSKEILSFLKYFHISQKFIRKGMIL